MGVFCALHGACGFIHSACGLIHIDHIGQPRMSVLQWLVRPH
jgi:hypothetical protein